MARAKRDRRSYSAGEWGRNRVRVFADPKTGLYEIEWRENGRRLTRSLKHRDWSRAKRQADEAAAGLAMYEPNGRAEAESAPLTLGRLFEIYGEEVVPTKQRRTQRQNRATMRMFLDFLGRDRRPGRRRSPRGPRQLPRHRGARLPQHGLRGPARGPRA